MHKTYSDLMQLETFDERLEYLRIHGNVGDATFGAERGLNQRFYNSTEWKTIRNHIIVRDNGSDMAIFDQPITGPISIHHINPLRPRDITEGLSTLFDPENLISVSHATHNAIHYGYERHLPRQLVERKPGDTTLW